MDALLFSTPKHGQSHTSHPAHPWVVISEPGFLKPGLELIPVQNQELGRSLEFLPPQDILWCCSGKGLWLPPGTELLEIVLFRASQVSFPDCHPLSAFLALSQLLCKALSSQFLCKQMFS